MRAELVKFSDLPALFYANGIPWNHKLDTLNIRRNKKVFFSIFQVTSSTRGMAFASYWGGGSKDTFTAWNKHGEYISLPITTNPLKPIPEDRTWIPNHHDILLEDGTFLGKPATPKFTVFIKEE